MNIWNRMKEDVWFTVSCQREHKGLGPNVYDVSDVNLKCLVIWCGPQRIGHCAKLQTIQRVGQRVLACELVLEEVNSHQKKNLPLCKPPGILDLLLSWSLWSIFTLKSLVNSKLVFRVALIRMPPRCRQTFKLRAVLLEFEISFLTLYATLDSLDGSVMDIYVYGHATVTRITDMIMCKNY